MSGAICRTPDVRGGAGVSGPRRFQILSLSGGGYLGLFTASLLEKLEEASGGPLLRRFDLIAGTSVGGLLALGLAAGKPAGELRAAFEARGEAIFSSRPKPRGWFQERRDLARSLRSAKYRPHALASAIDEMVGVETLMADLEAPVIVPAVNLTKGAPQVFKTRHHPSFVRDPRLRVRDVALATSAAPTFFPIHEIDGELFADGGLFANAPDALAVHEAEHFLGAGIDTIHMLSLGTTSTSFSMARQTGLNLGALGWLQGQRLPSVMIASQQKVAEAMLGHRLSDRYVRIDHGQSAEQQNSLALDVATTDAQSDLKGLAEGCARRALADQRIKAMLRHEAAQHLIPMEA